MNPSNPIRSAMKYRNGEMKLEQLINYLNEGKISLSPFFQRNRVWTLKTRQELIKNILKDRPIPAIFIYKDETSSEVKYIDNILDGKQRLESIMMFIGNKNPELHIDTINDYIFDRELRRQIGFSVDLGDGQKLKFKDLKQEIKKLREYRFAIIEVTVDEDSHIDEIVDLFVDINQRGEKVTRLDIVKAMKRNDPFLKQLYEFIATRQIRKLDQYIKGKSSNFTKVLKHLRVISRVMDRSARVDRMWQKLVELALFVRSKGTHRKPAEILKSFIREARPPKVSGEKLTKEEIGKLVAAFSFLAEAYKSDLVGTKLATDQTHFYTMSTALLSTDLIKPGFNKKELTRKLIAFGKLIDESHASDVRMIEYLNLSAKQTTDTEKRKDRQTRFVQLLATL